MSVRRGYGAALAALLWLFGFDVVPLVHMVLHETLEEHRHGHRHDQAHGHDDGTENGEPSPSEHGQGSVAHRDLAANVPLPAIPDVLEALLSWEAPALPAHDERPADPRPLTTRARAPPGSTA